MTQVGSSSPWESNGIAGRLSGRIRETVGSNRQCMLVECVESGSGEPERLGSILGRMVLGQVERTGEARRKTDGKPGTPGREDGVLAARNAVVNCGEPAASEARRASAASGGRCRGVNIRRGS
jgi:hypothetical protein